LRNINRDVAEKENAGRQDMAKGLNCTTSIEITQNNGIHCTKYGPEATLTRLRHLASEHKHRLHKFTAMGRAISNPNDFNQKMASKTSSLQLICAWVMVVELKIISLSF